MSEAHFCPPGAVVMSGSICDARQISRRNCSCGRLCTKRTVLLSFTGIVKQLPPLEEPVLSFSCDFALVERVRSSTSSSGTPWVDAH